MTEARARRVRPVAIRLTGRVAQALTRRTRQGTADAADDAPYVAEYFGEDTDTPLIELLKATPYVSQKYRGQTGSNVHVSDVISKCLRKIVLMERMELRHPTEKLVEGQGITFAIGDALHDYLTSRFVSGNPDKVWASWSCACGQTRKKGLYSKVSKFVCEQCDTSLTKHKEVAFPDEELQLTGSPDIILYMDEYGAYYIVELKSMSAAQWKELVRPVPDHVIQISFYWHLLHRAGWPLVNRCSILYANKEFSFKLPYKEFLIDPQVPGRLDPYLEDLQAFRDAREGGDLPTRTFCSSIDSAGAKACPVAVTCFGCK